MMYSFTVAQSLGMEEFEASWMQSHIPLFTGKDRHSLVRRSGVDCLEQSSGQSCQCEPTGGHGAQPGDELVETLLLSCSQESISPDGDRAGMRFLLANTTS